MSDPVNNVDPAEVVDAAGVVLTTPAPVAAPVASGATAESEPVTLVGLPELHVDAPVATSGNVILAVESPWHCDNFDPSISGAPVISRRGVSVPAQLVDQVISTGAANGVTIVKR